MRLVDLLKPDNEKEEETMPLRKMVRQKSFKTQVKALAQKQNPKDEDHNSADCMGDGGKDELPPTDSSTVNL